jgi:hypothetical protein
MKFNALARSLVRLCILSVAVCFLTGCQTWKYTAQHRGIYTIVYNPTNLPIENIDLDALRATAKTSFGTNEQPAVVIVGYSDKRKLKLLNRDTGKIVDSKLDFFVTRNSIIVKPLEIHQTGNYEIYFHELLEAREAFDFSVTRTPAQAARTNQIEPRALRRLSISLWLDPGRASRNYDQVFRAAVEQQWYNLLISTHTPYRRGVVILSFHMTDQGQFTDMKVVKNTASKQLAALCEQAVLNVAPYRLWPEQVRKKLPKNYRSPRFTFDYD